MRRNLLVHVVHCPLFPLRGRLDLFGLEAGGDDGDGHDGLCARGRGGDAVSPGARVSL